MNLLNDDDQLWERTAPCAFIEDSYFLRYITLGEVFFELKNVFMCLLSDKQANPMPLFREAIFSSFYEFSTQSFLRGFECSGFSEIKDDALNLLGLYEFCSLEANLFVWSDEDCKEVEAPPLETLTLNDWQRVVERLDSLFFQDSDWEMFSHFSQFEEKPQLPSFVEYRDIARVPQGPGDPPACSRPASGAACARRRERFRRMSSNPDPGNLRMAIRCDHESQACNLHREFREAPYPLLLCVRQSAGSPSFRVEPASPDAGIYHHL